jgi:hypothetical protein
MITRVNLLMSEELILLKKRNLEKHGKYARFNWAYLSFAGLLKSAMHVYISIIIILLYTKTYQHICFGFLLK